MIEQLTDDGRRPDLLGEIDALVREDRAAAEKTPRQKEAAGTTRSRHVRVDVEVPEPPDLERHLAELDLDEVWPLVNPQMLYGKHLGFRGSVEKAREQGDPKIANLDEVVAEVKRLGRDGLLRTRAVWQFFAARAEGNRLQLLDSSGNEAASWDLPRQGGEDGLCLADYVVGDDDHVALFVTTAGEGVREQVEAWRESGDYLKSHTLAALALETAEAAAEWIHRQLRAEWGFADSGDLSARDLFSAKYRGKRYSFGYPACPDLGGQQALFEVLRPKEIGVELTEGDMMDPEASVSALVFHHPDARYFGV